MIPFILAVVGGYLIGDSVGQEIDSKIPEFADGGMAEGREDDLFKEYEFNKNEIKLLERKIQFIPSKKYRYKEEIKFLKQRNKELLKNYPHFEKMFNEKIDKEGIDLFEDYQNTPANLQKVLDRNEDNLMSRDYKKIEKALRDVEKLGYTFDYELDGVPYDLRPMGMKGKNKFADGGVMEKAGTLHMKVEPSTFEEDMEEARMRMGKYWDTLTEQEKIEATKYLKSRGEVGHMGQEEDVEIFMANLNYKKGGKLK
jgi:hypothetical protein